MIFNQQWRENIETLISLELKWLKRTFRYCKIARETEIWKFEEKPTSLWRELLNPVIRLEQPIDPSIDVWVKIEDQL